MVRSSLPALMLVLAFCTAGSLHAQEIIFESDKAKSAGQTEYSAQINNEAFLARAGNGMSFDIQLDGINYEHRIHRVSRLSNGYTGINFRSGNGSPVTSHLLVRDNRITNGVIHVNNGHYQLIQQNDTYRLTLISEETEACFGEVFSGEDREKSTTGGEFVVPGYDLDDYADTTTVDVLLLYTTSAKNWAANSSAVTDINDILAFSELFKEETLANSEIALKIRFVDFKEIANSTDTSSSTKLFSMANNSYSGSSDTVDIYSLRDQAGADLVALIDSISDTGGIAYLPRTVRDNSGNGYSVNRVQQMYFNYVLVHEMGHNFGNAHGRTQPSQAAGESGGIFQFSTGHRMEAPPYDTLVTIMHYPNLGTSVGTRLPYFSNPRVNFNYSADGNDYPTGSYTSPGSPSDNALSMSITKNWVADFRATAIDPAQISVSTTAVEDTVLPAGVTTRKFVVSNTGTSDLEIKIDGEMEFSSALKAVTNTKQPLDLNYGFESSEGFNAGSYSGYNNWISLDDSEPFEISSEESFSGTQSLKIPSASGSPIVQSPFFAASSRYSFYNISFKMFSEATDVVAVLSFNSSFGQVAAGLNPNNNGGNNDIGFYGYLDSFGFKSFFDYGDDQIFGEWADVSIDITTDNGGSISYSYTTSSGGTSSRSFIDNGFFEPNNMQISLNSSSTNDLFIDDLSITATDLYGPALAISDSRITIRPGQTDTVEVTFYGNDNAEGNYSGLIYLETNDPASPTLTIPVSLRIDPAYSISTGDFAIELTGTEGFRMLTTPADVMLKDLLEPVWTQGATDADTTIGSPNIWTWNNTYSGSDNGGWTPVTDLNSTLSAGDAVLVYVYDLDDPDDPESAGFPKLLPVSGNTISGTTPDINDNPNGFTFVGNPFGATIDWDNLDKTDLAATVYVWDPNDSNWKSYNGVGDLTDGLIKPFQGFIVQSAGTITTGTALSIDSGDIASGGNFLGKESAPRYLRLIASDSTNVTSNSAYVIIDERALFEQDDLDGFELSSLVQNYVQLSTQSGDGVNLDLNSMPEIQGEMDIPLTVASDFLSEVDLQVTDISGLTGYEFYLLTAEQTIPLEAGKPVKVKLNTKDSSSGELSDRLPKVVLEQANEFTLRIVNAVQTSTEPDVAVKYALLQNYPNPFNPVTVIRFDLPASGLTELKVFDMLGREVAVLVDERLNAGSHQVSFNAQYLASGIYIYRLKADGKVLTRKLTLIK